MAHLAEAGKLTLKDVKELEDMLSERENRPKSDREKHDDRGGRPSRKA
jgi:hypothetical protein